MGAATFSHVTHTLDTVSAMLLGTNPRLDTYMTEDSASVMPFAMNYNDDTIKLEVCKSCLNIS